MKRIILMVLKNIIFVPYWFWQLCYYAKHSQKISEDKKLALLKKIVRNANKGGNVEIQSYGLENIPKGQSFMFFPNHQGMYDVLAMIDGAPSFFSVVMKKELQNIFFLKQVFQIMGAYAIDREDVRQSMKVIQQVSQEVSNGKSFLIFPEGTRSRNGNQIGEFKGGSFKGAVKAKCPIVPVAIIDSYKAFDTHSIEKVVVQVHYLEPLCYEDYKMMKTTEIAEIVSKSIKKTIDIYDTV
ncbi:MAG: 1-acyl-sn-glycerol-3-phosphate acyltransferase [Clostridiales bacterium]|nr:1-acyl-sn-glycerol-3-phosphate acyltransferase [Clostridiales bacterium]